MVRNRRILQLQVLKYFLYPIHPKFYYVPFMESELHPVNTLKSVSSCHLVLDQKSYPEVTIRGPGYTFPPNFHIVISYGMVRLGFTEKKIYNRPFQKLATILKHSRQTNMNIIRLVIFE